MAVIVTAAPTLLAVGQDTVGVVHRIEIRRFEFLPETLEVAPGDTVVWANLDIVPHTASAEDASWDSEYLAPGAEWEMSVTADTPGRYLCRYHPTMVAVLNMSHR